MNAPATAMRTATRERIRLHAVDTDGRAGWRFVEAACFGGLCVVGGVGVHPVSGKTVEAFIFVHRDTGRYLVPRGWFFTDRTSALAALSAILDRLPGDDMSLRELAPRGALFMDEMERAGAVTGANHAIRALGRTIDYPASDALRDAAWEAERKQRQAAGKPMPEREERAG